jgi:general secretion pathway protein A
VAHYIQHRMMVSGAHRLPAFTAPALWRIHRYSSGVPRLVNAVCDKLLLAAYVHQTDRIDYSLVGLAIRELEGHISN